jgi:ribosome-binding protein aMBF1 (putative translation factor)
VRKSKAISDQLREAIAAAGVSRYEISKQTGINQSILSRFMRGETNMDGATIDKLGTYLGLELVCRRRQREEERMAKDGKHL